MYNKHDFKTIILSDLHLGTSGSKAREATVFIKDYSCENLILNGDIIDGWQLKKTGVWKKKHTGFIRALLKTIQKTDTKVTYLRGNHDDFLDQILPLTIGSNFNIVRDVIYESRGKKYYITHGDVFDLVTKKMKWLAHIGDTGYTFLLWLNKNYNQYRKSRGLPYYSLSQKVKQSIKLAVNYISDYEEQLCELAKSKNCDGIICGHIHHPVIKKINNTIYMNSGDWVENMSALVEHYDGTWELVYHAAEEKQEEMDIKDDYFSEEGVVADEGYAHLFELK